MIRQPNESRDTILLVDDEPHYLDWLVDYLEAKGYSVVTATSLDAALDLLSGTRYRVVVCDLSVPVSDKLVPVLAKKHGTYLRYPGAYAAFTARNRGHRPRQVVVYSVHESADIQRIADTLGVQYITKGRPSQLKQEMDIILSYDPSSDGQEPTRQKTGGPVPRRRSHTRRDK